MAENGSTEADDEPIDPFFETIPDSRGNACVGPQGDELQLVEGYVEASSLLADIAMEGDVTLKDRLVMPILYSLRHGLELSFKFAVRELAKIGLIEEIQGRANHDIRRYYDHLTHKKVADLETRQTLASLEPYVTSLARIDEDGQQFRFFADIDDKPTLPETPVINIPLVQKSARAVRPLVKSLHEAIERLLLDHPAGTSTSECSRRDLFNIARQLGPYDTWNEPEFDEIKAAIAKEFDLSSQAFSRALNAIKNSRELGSEVGIETDLKYLTAERSTQLCELCFEHLPPPPIEAEGEIISVARNSLEDILAPSPGYKFAKAALDAFSRNEIADAQTIFYIARNRTPGDLYNDELAVAIIDHQDDRQHPIRTHDVLGKLNFADEFIAGLRKVGQPSLSKSLDELRNARRSSI